MYEAMEEELRQIDEDLAHLEAPVTRVLRQLEDECRTKTGTYTDDTKTTGLSERRRRLVTMESVSPVLDSPDTESLPLVLNAPSNASRDNILVLRTAGPNSEIYFLNKTTNALIPVDQLTSGEMPVLSTLSQYRGMREEGPILPTLDGFTEK